MSLNLEEMILLQDSSHNVPMQYQNIYQRHSQCNSDHKNCYCLAFFLRYIQRIYLLEILHDKPDHHC